MEKPSIAHFLERLKSPWLLENPIQEKEFSLCVKKLKRSSVGNDQFTVLLAESDPRQFLIHFLAAVGLRLPVFLANPDWKANEWEQVAQTIKPDLVVGKVKLATQAPSCRYSRDLSGQIMIPTGGSAGRVKFTVHTWETLGAAVESLSRFLRQPQLNAVCALPLYHVSGLMQALRSFMTGGQLLLVESKRLEQGEFPAILPGVFYLSLVPTQLVRLMSSEGGVAWLRQLDTLFLGGARLNEAVAQRARELQLPVALAYGMTETAAMVAIQSKASFLAGEPMAGEILPHVEIAIEEGEIAVSCRSLCLGYYPEPFLNWSLIKTGDEGYIAADGRLVVLGRKDRIINTGGEKVDPTEVEQVLQETGQVKSSLIVGKPDPEWGQKLAAFYLPVLGFEGEIALTKTLKERLPNYKVPKIWVQLERLPIDERGKIDRAQIDELLRAKPGS